MPDFIHITWLGHSCFKIESEGYILVLDPYQDFYVPGLRKINTSAHSVLCSHQHKDHCGVETITLLDQEKKNPFLITILESYHDHELGAKRGKNNITILEYKGIRIVHFGDQGCLPRPDQMDLLKDADAIMIPVGGFYTIDALEAQQIIQRIEPKIIIPMHYRSDKFGYPAIAKIDDFLKLASNVVFLTGNSLIIDKNCTVKTVVLSLIND